MASRKMQKSTQDSYKVTICVDSVTGQMLLRYGRECPEAFVSRVIECARTRGIGFREDNGD